MAFATVATIKVDRGDCEVANFFVPNIAEFFLERVSPGEAQSNHLLSIRHLDKTKLRSIREAIPLTTRVGSDKIWCRSRACSACRLMASMDSLIIRSQFHSTDAIEYTILCSSIGAAKSIVEVLRTGGLRAILLSAGEVSYPLSLTAREIEILLIAHERGLFDDKRRTTVRELAKELSISATTLSNIIRRSVRKIVELQLESVR